MTPKRNHSRELKAKVAIEAVKSIKTINEIASQYEVHPNLVTSWKKQLLTQASSLFSAKRENAEKEQEALIARLYQQIGQLGVSELVRRKTTLRQFTALRSPKKLSCSKAF